MYVSSEFGMGLNSYSRCEGNCYIEDESAYGTFHIGFGRNIALGGVHEARGHFDLVSLNPDVYADNMKIMDRGRIIVPEFHIY
jgi:leucyl aminopeptidase (aminopeptidase T)